ncbi:MAG: 1-deoxy-D-xylulose-5-phosphate reductoisomerase [Bacillota bacterium]
MKNVVIFGSTGSVGTQTLDVIEKNSESFNVLAVIGNKNIPLLEKQWEKFNPKYVGVFSQKAGEECEKSKAFAPSVLIYGEDVEKLASLEEADIVVIASGGISSLPYLISAIKAGKHIALANKETIVSCGDLLLEMAKQTNAKIYPVDSEHSALWQCSRSERKSDITRLILTASGGGFLKTPICDLKKITPQMAVKHPNWNMGGKITVDSGTMVNKALELIEACHLFGFAEDKIEVVIHPQSIIHSMVEYRDKTTLAHMSNPSMEIPILQAMTTCYRGETNVSPLDFSTLSQLTFEVPQKERHEAIWLAREVIRRGGFYPLAFNVANEVLVEAFFEGKIKFTDIVNKNRTLLNKIDIKVQYNIENVYKAIAQVEKETKGIIND